MDKKEIEEKIRKLEEKLTRYEKKLANRKLGYGEVTRTGSGDSYSDQLRDDTNTLQAMINTTKEAIESLKKR